MSAYYVYRIFDDAERLIYVGCTNKLFDRLKFHASTTWWGYQFDHAVAKVYRDRPTALAAERAAISAEHPRWNRMGAWKNNRVWTKQHFIDYVQDALHQQFVTPHTASHLANVGRLYEARFGESMTERADTLNVPLAAIITPFSVEDVVA